MKKMNFKIIGCSLALVSCCLLAGCASTPMKCKPPASLAKIAKPAISESAIIEETPAPDTPETAGTVHPPGETAVETPGATEVLTEPAPMDIAAESEAPALSYFPVAAGNEWIYESNMGTFTVTTAKGNLENEYIYVSKVRNITAESYLIIGKSEVACRKQKMNIFLMKDEFSYSPPQVRYPLPIEPEKKFAWKGYKIQGAKRTGSSLEGEISEAEYDIEVPAGKFSCLKLESHYACADGIQQYFTQWLAPGVGVVKMDCKIEGSRTGVLGYIQQTYKVKSLNIELKSYRVN